MTWRVSRLEDLQREIKKNLDPNLEVIPESVYNANPNKYSVGLVSIGYQVPVFRKEQECAGETTKCRVRLTFAERRARVQARTHANKEGSTADRAVRQVALILEAGQTTNDVSGAFL